MEIGPTNNQTHMRRIIFYIEFDSNLEKEVMRFAKDKLVEECPLRLEVVPPFLLGGGLGGGKAVQHHSYIGKIQPFFIYMMNFLVAQTRFSNPKCLS